MILVVLADAGQVGDDVDPELTQLCGRPDAGKLQDLWRRDRAGREDHFAQRRESRPSSSIHAVARLPSNRTADPRFGP